MYGNAVQSQWIIVGKFRHKGLKSLYGKDDGTMTSQVQTVPGWRITFKVEGHTISEIDFEDYH